MQFRDYYRSLSTDEKRDFAARSGTTHAYLYAHLQIPRKQASLNMIQRLTSATDGAVSLAEMVEHFSHVK